MSFVRLVPLLLVFGVVSGSDIVVFGDSWGTEGATSFSAMAASHGLTVDNAAVGGTTAAHWARSPDKLKEVVDGNPDCKWVWLTIGGNDAMPKMELHEDPAKIAATAVADTQKFLDPLFEARPDVRVVQFGYDILGWDKNPLCKSQAKSIFWNCTDPTGSVAGIDCANAQFYTLQHEYVEVLTLSYGNHDAIDLRGSLQKAGGVEGADVGLPNDDYYSPADLMQSNCIHANDEGFDAIFANMWEIYFSKQVVS